MLEWGVGSGFMSHRIKPMTIICLCLWSLGKPNTVLYSVLYFSFSSATLLRRYRQVRVITASKKSETAREEKKKKKDGRGSANEMS